MPQEFLHDFEFRTHASQKRRIRVPPMLISALCRVPNYAAQTRPISQNDAQNKRARNLADRLLGIVRRLFEAAGRPHPNKVPSNLTPQECARGPL